MKSQFNAAVAREMSHLGYNYGRELASALVLASTRSGVDREMKEQMVRLVLAQLEAAALKLSKARLPDPLAAAYRKGAREGVYDELMRNEAVADEVERSAA